MQNEFKVADLARLWNISVTATWSRIRKENLTTTQKMFNNKDITFVTVPDEILNKYKVVEVVNNDNKVNNQANCKELLSESKVDEVDNKIVTQAMIDFANLVNNKLIELNNDYNERLTNYIEKHNEDINEHVNNVIEKEKEIAELKAENKILKGVEAQKKEVTNKLLTAIIILAILLITSVGYIIVRLNY